MRILKRMGGVLLPVLLLLSLMLSGYAAQQPYTYRVTFHAGAQGSFVQDAVTVRGKDYSVQRTDDTVTITGLHQGDRVIWDSHGVTLNEGSRYYVRGVRLSGRDNNTVDATSFIVQGDRDYVVAYGVRGDAVAYHVRYEDENGRELHESRTLYGNVGDKPVVAAVYIEGYLPQAWNLTGTLKADESKNVFTFVYRAGMSSDKTNQGESGGNGGTNQTSNPQTDTPQTGNSQTPADQNPQTEQNLQTPENGEAAAEEGDSGEQPASEEEVPELIDIDDEETPLARGTGAALENEANRVGLLFPAVAVCSAAVVIGLTVWWHFRDKKRKKPTDTDEK